MPVRVLTEPAQSHTESYLIYLENNGSGPEVGWILVGCIVCLGLV